MSTARRVSLAVASVVVLAGCSTGGEEPAAATTAPLVPSASATAESPPAATSDVPVSQWSDEGSATAGLADFLAALQAADHYLVDRQERTDIGGKYIEINLASVVDVAAARAQSTQTYAVSDEAMWADLSPAGQSVEETKSNTMRTVVDFSTDPPVSYLTYLGDYGWQGQWFVLDPAAVDPDDLASDAPVGADPDALIDLLSSAEIGDFTLAVTDVAALDPTAFQAGSGSLSFDVPAEVAALWMPNQLVSSLQGAGVDPLELGAVVRADITPIPGGIRAVLELAPLLREAAESVEDPNVAAYLTSVSVPITVRVHDLGTGERVELPAPDTVVTEPPTD